ncbi:MAG: GntR family transcriptional regulator [Pleomorphochaeta sp.]
MARINKKSEEIYEELKNKIFEGELKTGERLIETKLAKDKGVNKIHVSYALNQLAEDNLVEYKLRRGYFVRRVDNTDFLEFIKIREMLEKELIIEFLDKSSDSDIEESVKMIKRKLAFLNADLLEDADEETNNFFEKMTLISNYNYIPKIMHQYQSYIMEVINSEFKFREDIKVTIEVNELLLKALESRNPDLGIKWAKERYQYLLHSCILNLKK